MRNRARNMELLSTVSLFANLSRSDLKTLASAGREMRLSPGEVVVREEQIGSKLIIITSGTASVVHEDQEVQLLQPGDMLGELTLPSHSVAVARETVTVLVIDLGFVTGPLS